MRKMVQAATLMAAIVFLSQCSGEKAAEKRAERAIEKATGGKAKVDLSKDKVSFKTKDGEMTIAQAGNVAIPEGFPKDVLIYKGAAAKMAIKQKGGFSITLETADDMKKVADAYQSDLKANGWEEQAVMSMGDGTSLSYEKGKDKEKRHVIIGINKGDDKGKTNISVTVMAEQ